MLLLLLPYACHFEAEHIKFALIQKVNVKI